MQIFVISGLDENPARVDNEDAGRSNARDFAIDLLNLDSALTPQLAEPLNTSIAIDSTAFKDIDHTSNTTVFIGSKTEMVLLKPANNLGWAKLQGRT